MQTTFDTHMVVKRLQQTGFSVDQAELLSDIFKTTREEALASLATKDDLKQLENRLESYIDKKISQVDVKIESLKGEFNLLKGEIGLLKWMFGVLVAGIVTILVRLFAV